MMIRSVVRGRINPKKSHQKCIRFNDLFNTFIDIKNLAINGHNLYNQKQVYSVFQVIKTNTNNSVISHVFTKNMTLKTLSNPQKMRSK